MGRRRNSASVALAVVVMVLAVTVLHVSLLSLLLVLAAMWTLFALRVGAMSATAVLVGFELQRAWVGPLRLERHDGAMRLRWYWRLYGSSGAVAVPVTADRLGRRWCLMLAAGLLTLPVSAALAVGASLPILARLPAGSPGVWASVVAVLWAVALVACVYTLVRVLPLRVRGVPLDGLQLWWWWRDKAAARRWVAATTMVGLAVDGARPRDWPDEWVRLAQGPADGSPEDVLATWLVMQWAGDRGDEALELAALDRAVAAAGRLRGPQRAAVLVDAAFVTARRRQDADSAANLLDRATSAGPVHQVDRLAAKAAILLARGEHEAAAEAARAWSGAVPARVPMPGLLGPATEEMARLQTEAQRRAAGLSF